MGQTSCILLGLDCQRVPHMRDGINVMGYNNDLGSGTVRVRMLCAFGSSNSKKAIDGSDQWCYTLFLFYKNHFYKNVEAEICPQI